MPSTGLVIVTFGGVLFTDTINVACADKLPLSVTVSVTTYSVGTPGWGGEGVRGVGLRAHRRTVAKVPRVGDRLAIRIVRTTAAQLHRQRRGAIISVSGGNCDRRPIAGIRNLS